MSLHLSFSSSTIENVLLRSKRRCAVCFASGIEQAKQGAIVRLDRDPVNDKEDNLVFLCLDHHALFDSGIELTASEIRTARDSLYSELAVGDESVARPPTPALLFEEHVVEVLTSQFRQSLGESCTLYRRKMLPSHGGGVREVDLAVEFTLGGLRFIMIVEIKFVRGKLGLNELQAFSGLLEDVGANKGMLVSNGTFTVDAVRFASAKGIALMKIQDDRERQNARNKAKPLPATMLVVS